jgi:two-component system response regulator YesN
MFHVLVAEDELWIRSALVEIIESLGGDFKVVGEAANGEEAWGLIHELWPTILVTDILMPKMDGLELAKQIWEHKLPIMTIIISGHDNFQYAQQAIRYNVSEYLLKPLREEEIARALQNSLDNLDKLRVEHSYTAGIRGFFENLEVSDIQTLSRDLFALVDSLLSMKGMQSGLRIGLLRIVSGKLHEMIAGVYPAHKRTSLPAGEAKEINIYFQELLEIWFRYYPQMVSGDTRHAIRRTCEYVNQNYMLNITLSAMARNENLSLSYFSTLFKQSTGESFVNYLNRIRIEHAKKLLLEPDIKIYEISELVGYCSLPYFNRVFKHWTAMSPNEYRKRLGL